jgi:Icc-related predicted phosphoesterase
MARDIKILAIADLHGRPDRLSPLKGVEADLIAFCGDLHDLGSREDARPVAQALADLGPPVLIVPGNMDPREFVEDLWMEVGLIPIHRQAFTYKGCGFLGMGGMVVRNPKRLGDKTKYYHQDEEVYSQLLESHSKIEGLEQVVIITHQPPRGALDTIYTGEVTGCVSLRRFLEEKQPDLLICGHIHEGRGEDCIGRTKIVNVGDLRSGNAALIDLKGQMKVSWISQPDAKMRD